jgi:hypothetical protein
MQLNVADDVRRRKERCAGFGRLVTLYVRPRGYRVAAAPSENGLKNSSEEGAGDTVVAPRTHGRLTGRPCGRADRPFVTLRFNLVAEQPVAVLHLV